MAIVDKLKETVGITPTYDVEEREKIRAHASTFASAQWFKDVLSHHQEIEEAFEAVEKASAAPAMIAAQQRLATLLTAHSIAEEAVIYPAIKMAGHAAHAKHAYAEQAMAKIGMAELDELRLLGEDKDYFDKLAELRVAVMHHMVEEERELFPELAKGADASLNERLTANYQLEFHAYVTGKASADDSPDTNAPD